MNAILAETRIASGPTLQLVRGDLTDETVDAIVNAANEQLRHGAGVAGAIVRRGGPAIRAESEAWVRTRGLQAPAWTSGGDLPCRTVIHAVGPVWGSGDEDAKLTAAVSGSLKAADGLGLASIAFPAISTGIFGFPKERAAGVMLAAIQAYFAANESKIRLVRLVLFDPETAEAFQPAWSTIL